MKVETQDFYFAVFCNLNNVELVEMKDYGSRKMFVFNDTKEYQKLKRAYY